MPCGLLSRQNCRIDALPIVPHAQTELPIAVSDSGFDVMRVSVSESVAEGLCCNPVAFVAQDGMQIARLNFQSTA
jgi:hypothetical protein